ncbi:hypothetical protein SAMN04488522_104103 [Pedobacter caeni]|uniref:Uncharacterized protein n=1 Tax=Pedobacter caeni TaxID=288992 RepID=A0A1M5G858_9SPHI|nr:hypothetical protein SAMN04488522_104103 [Pedobacter caeni]
MKINNRFILLVRRSEKKVKKMVKFEALPFFNTQMKPELRYSFRLGKISLINSIRTLFTNYVCFNIYNKFNANFSRNNLKLVSGRYN